MQNPRRAWLDDNEIGTWTVILLVPDYLADSFGTDIHACVTVADSPAAALDAARQHAFSSYGSLDSAYGESPDDFGCVAVIRGAHKIENPES